MEEFIGSSTLALLSVSFLLRDALLAISGVEFFFWLFLQHSFFFDGSYEILTRSLFGHSFVFAAPCFWFGIAIDVRTWESCIIVNIGLSLDTSTDFPFGILCGHSTVVFFVPRFFRNILHLMFVFWAILVVEVFVFVLFCSVFCVIACVFPAFFFLCSLVHSLPWGVGRGGAFFLLRFLPSFVLRSRYRRGRHMLAWCALSPFAPFFFLLWCSRFPILSRPLLSLNVYFFLTFYVYFFSSLFFFSSSLSLSFFFPFRSFQCLAIRVRTLTRIKNKHRNGSVFVLYWLPNPYLANLGN